jgi:hypothetical protein
MVSIHDLKDVYAGRPGAVLGGGPSLPEDLSHVPAWAVLISVNQHALLISRADYLVFMDVPHPLRHAELYDAVKEFAGVKVSPQRDWSDVDLQGQRRIALGDYSGHLATWLALWMGCEPVILAGMDCYQGDEAYYYKRPRPRKPKPTLKQALRGWMRVKEWPGAERIRAVSGPLVEVFGSVSVETPLDFSTKRV